MAELGQTNDPVALIPGDAGAVLSTARALAGYGDVLDLAGKGLARIDTTDGWSGAAADAFRHVYHGNPGKWTTAGNAFQSAAQALGNYTSTLTWAQGQATEAIRVWNSGKANHPDATQILDNARGQLEHAANTAAAVIGKARDLAPPKPGFWSEVGSFFSGVGHGTEAITADVVNGVASLANAAVQNPGADLSTVLGLNLIAAGAGGEAGGILADGTVVLAPAGLAINALSAATIAGGGALTAAGVGTIFHDAATNDRVTIMHADSGGDGGYQPPPRSYSSSPGSIANSPNYDQYTPKEIKEAIHAVKAQGGWRGLGGQRNPDVVVDTNTGEVYPKLPDGSPADDSIGNIADHLPES